MTLRCSEPIVNICVQQIDIKGTLFDVQGAYDSSEGFPIASSRNEVRHHIGYFGLQILVSHRAALWLFESSWNALLVHVVIDREFQEHSKQHGDRILVLVDP